MLTTLFFSFLEFKYKYSDFETIRVISFFILILGLFTSFIQILILGNILKIIMNLLCNNFHDIIFLCLLKHYKCGLPSN